MLTTIATATASNPGLFQALGIDWKLLVEQGVAFLILVGVMAKFVYPVIIKSIDDRRNSIETAMQEVKDSQEAFVQAEAKVTAMLEQARKDADDLLARAHQEAASQVSDAETKAKQRAEQIIADARAQLAVDVTKARETLKRDTVELVALATERVIGEKLDAHKDAALVKQALTGEKA